MAEQPEIPGRSGGHLQKLTKDGPRDKLTAIDTLSYRRTAFATILVIAFLGSLASNHGAGLTAGLAAATAFLAIVEMLRQRRVPREAWLLLLPFGWWSFSYLLTRESPSVFFSLGFLRRDGAIFASLLPLAALAALPLDRRRVMAALYLYLIFQSAIAVIGGIGALTGWHTAIFRPAELVDHQATFFGLYIAHNATASVYVLLALGAFAWALRPENDSRFRNCLFVIAGLLAMGCVLARSRGAYLALGAGLVFIVIRAMRQDLPRRLKVVALVGVIVVMAAGSRVMIPRFLRAIDQGWDKDRRTEWTKSWGHFRRSPVVGIGFGRYNDVNPEFTSIGIGEVATKAVVYNDDRHAHNSYLHWLAEGGGVGLAVMIVFWILVARGVRGDDPLRDWILAGIAAMAVLSLTEHYAGGGAFLMHLAFLIGVHQSREES